jgi:uncharacterized protein Yka (UPF0111/DUF47 family)
MLPDKVNQKIQEALKKFQDNKNKEYETIQKQIKELIRALNKHQTETENTVKREINKLRKKIDNIKKEVILKKRMKQKYKTQWKATPAE